MNLNAANYSSTFKNVFGIVNYLEFNFTSRPNYFERDEPKVSFNCFVSLTYLCQLIWKKVNTKGMADI